MRLPTFLRHPRTAVLARWGRVPGLRTAKATLAAVLSYVAADLRHTTDAPILAPLTALLVVQLTVYDTVAQSIQRILSVLAGVLVAVGIATFVGLSWWSLGAVVAMSLVVGQLLRLGTAHGRGGDQRDARARGRRCGRRGCGCRTGVRDSDRRRDRPRGQLRNRPTGERAAGRRCCRTVGRPAGGVPAWAGRRRCVRGWSRAAAGRPGSTRHGRWGRSYPGRTCP